MKIGFLSIPLSGHMNPMTALGRKLQSRGNEVTFIAVPDMEPTVRAAGLNFVAYCEKECPKGYVSKEWSSVAKMRGNEIIDYTLKYLSPPLTKAALEHLPGKIEETGVEALVIDTAHFFLELVPIKLGIPYVQVWNVLNMDLSGLTPACLFSWPYETTPEALARNAEGAQWIGGLLGSILEAALPYAEKVGLKIDWNDPAATASKLAILSQTPKEFDFPNIPWPPRFHYTGPFHDSGGRELPPFPWEELNGKPLIYASLGTLVNGLDHVYRAILDAVRTLADVQVVLSVGKNVNYGDLGQIPSNTILVRSAPQIELLKRSSLCITHAGLNTTLESLAQGVPMVAIPIGYDQPGVARRIAHHGVGEFVELEDLTVRRLSELIQEVRMNPSYRDRARYFQEAIANTRGLDMAAEIIEKAFENNRTANSNGKQAELSHA
jgi:zeaxanthin glucosyltransferase